MLPGVPVSRRGRRLAQLYLGLLLYGVSDGMLLLAGLGVDPWDVLHQGLSRRIGLGVGTWALIVGAFVLLLWVPLRQRPGFGTVSNALLVGPVIDLVLVLVPAPTGTVARIAMLLGGVVLNGVATGAYIGAGLGPGPRDGLMTGMAARGHSLRAVRTAIEVTVLVLGWVLGGTVGIGTVVYALGIGPLVHVFLPLFRIADVDPEPPPPRGPALAPGEITLRPGAGDDELDLLRLAALDSAEPLSGSILLVEVSGRLAAALSLRDGRVIADPFQPTAAVVALLQARAAQLTAGPGRRDRRRRWARALRVRPARRALS